MDRQAFKQRMQQLKQYREQNPGKTYLDWKNSLPSNLQDESNYNLRRAYELGYEPEWNEDDKSYHLPTRDSETGEILKKPWHPTFLIGLQEDAKLGYYPQIKNGTMYTTTWEGNENPIYKYADGGQHDVDDRTDHSVNKPFIPGIIEAKDTATGKSFNDLTEYEKDLWRRSHGMDHYGKKIARGNLTEVYPEFDIISGIRGITNTIRNVSTVYKNKRVADTFNKTFQGDRSLNTPFVDNKTITYNPINPSNTGANFSKAQSNYNLMNLLDEFADRYGYPKANRSTILSNRRTNAQIRKTIATHNTYLRGVDPNGFEPDDILNVKRILGDNITQEDFMKYAATHKRTPDQGIWITPGENAFIYGSRGKTAYVRRPYKLGKNRDKWFDQGNFEIQPGANGEISAPWYSSQYGIGHQESELISNTDLNFAGWANPDRFKNKVSLNDKVINKFKMGGQIDSNEIPPSNKPIIPEEPQPYKGKLYKDRYGRKYTEDQLDDYYDNSSDEIDRFTGKPFIRGLKPMVDLEDAANVTPIGDAISIYDTYEALRNKDWGNAGLAALGLVPFMPRFGGVAVKSSKKISKPKSTYIPKVDPNYKQNVIDKALHEQKSYSDMPLSLVEEINDQRNRTYDLMQEPYARERAKAVDHQYGTDYLKVYDSMLEKYVDIDEYFQLPEPKYKKMERPTIGAQVTPSEGNTIYFNRDMIKVPEDIPNSVVLHEMGHLVDGATGMNNEFLRKLGDKSKFVPFNQAKTMYPNMTRDMYNNILQGTEIKSYMNQFRNYLDQKGKLNRGNYTGSYKNLKKEIIDAPRESFNNIKAIFNLYRSPKLFNKDFQMIPIVNNNDNNTIV